MAASELECCYVGELRAILESMYEWQQDYVVPREGIRGFLECLLQITDLAGLYGRSRILVLEHARTALLSMEAATSARERDEAYTQELRDELEDHWREEARPDYGTSEPRQQPAYDSEDLDDIDYRQDRSTPDDPEEP